MKKRILTGWTLARGLYLVMGIIILVQSIIQQEWFGILIGGYFASMGIFSFGCAAGNCFAGTCNTQTMHVPKTETSNAEPGAKTT